METIRSNRLLLALLLGLMTLLAACGGTRVEEVVPELPAGPALVMVYTDN
jgi:hypothetical protein